MRKEIKLLIVEIVIAIIVIIMFVLMFNFNKDFGKIKFISFNNIMDEHNKLTEASNEYESITSSYENSLQSLEREKSNYEVQKNKYLAISDETLNMIKEATAEESFDIEYMWITLGNYAKRNNLSIYLLEPGYTAIEEQKPESNEDQVSGNVNEEKSSTSDNSQTTVTGSSDEFKIKVEGSYIDLAEFVFNIENDKTLRFKLDKIDMKLVSGTKVEANFVVKNLKLIK